MSKAKIFDIKLEKEITLDEAVEQLKKAIQENKLEVAAYYNRLVTQLLVQELREKYAKSKTS